MEIISQSAATLQTLDTSYIQSNELHRPFMTALQQCHALVYLDLTGCS